MLNIILILVAQTMRNSEVQRDAELGNLLVAGAIINLLSKVN